MKQTLNTGERERLDGVEAIIKVVQDSAIQGVRQCPECKKTL